MSNMQLLALLPLLIPAGAAVLVLLGVALKRSFGATFFLSLLAFTAGFAALFTPGSAVMIPSLLTVDHYARYFMGLTFLSNFVVTLLAYRYIAEYGENREEFFLLLLLETIGALVLVSSTHFASLFLGYEITSVSLYGLIGYNRLKERSIEAGVKYLILGGVSSAFLLFGMALVYADLGTMALDQLSTGIMKAGGVSRLALVGISMIIVGIGFKLAWVPFHMWTADVYQGAPVPVTASLTTVSKIAVFALLIRLFHGIPILDYPALYWMFAIIAGFSMLLGNWLALMQRNVKRMLAYSSISHFGYLILPLLAGGERGAESAAFYLTAYTVATLGSFGVLTVLSNPQREHETMEDFDGLGRQRPMISAVFTFMLLSLAGIPVTIGFIGKFFLLRAGLGSSLWALSLILVAGTSISFFYYLRLVVLLFRRGEADEREVKASKVVSLAEHSVMVFLVTLLVGFGAYPAPLIRLIQAMMRVIG